MAVTSSKIASGCAEYLRLAREWDDYLHQVDLQALQAAELQTHVDRHYGGEHFSGKYDCHNRSWTAC